MSTLIRQKVQLYHEPLRPKHLEPSEQLSVFVRGPPLVSLLLHLEHPIPLELGVLRAGAELDLPVLQQLFFLTGEELFPDSLLPLPRRLAILVFRVVH